MKTLEVNLFFYTFQFWEVHIHGKKKLCTLSLILTFCNSLGTVFLFEEEKITEEDK